MLLTLLLVFLLGYLLITLEDVIHLNKTATALITGVLCWTIYALSGVADGHAVSEQLGHHLIDIAEILFFLLGAMTIVELIDAHDGFTLITDRIASRNTRTLLWISSFLAFFLSALLDNLTTAIVMVSVLRKLVHDPQQRRIMAGMTIVACNAGGVWSPIGDVTTTMLWIGGQVTTLNIIKTLLLPSLVAMLVPLGILTMRYPAATTAFVPSEEEEGVSRPYVTRVRRRDRRLMLAIGLGGMLFVPIFKTLTGLPPYMGMMLVLGVIWVASEVIHKDKDEAAREPLTPAYALQNIDSPSILFFLGILLAVGALEAVGGLRLLADSLNESVGQLDVIVLLIGLVSAVVDNVPIVAAAMGMYDLQTFPTDNQLWEFLAYCAGTGGSILLIGSAAGVAVMGMEKLEFGWYLRKISWLALLGYLAGAGVYLGQVALLR
ncbi:sodium:proton antiporter NhaD [Fibrella aquatilis]|uniref:Sodium:proton antiporter NhaD n=1 Tax=Fibrella aquatilis TaxID=2817059 RepID=A0A939GC04_9BACT|nr:sodium:proton antiporter NhaD [Fibrella aquatilis]MBO0934454.1 sodium:proton antiporter NhaD [Fibrella aquatilis]